jgi:putative endonuclease
VSSTDIGKIGERAAQQYYVQQEYRILATNVQNNFGKRLGEIDFIAISPTHIIFVEVKTRSGRLARFGTAAESVTRKKQQRILKTVHWFLASNKRYQNLTPQIDVCAVEIGIDSTIRSCDTISNAIEDWS